MYINVVSSVVSLKTNDFCVTVVEADSGFNPKASSAVVQPKYEDWTINKVTAVKTSDALL